MKSNQKGFSLIEVLVTLIVMAIGISGLMAVQVNSMKNVNNSQYRTVATYFAYDMAERMRANPVGLAAGAYNAINGSETNPGTSACKTATCSGADLAKVDAYDWNTAIKKLINEGGLGANALGTVTAAAGLYTIQVAWTEQDRADPVDGKTTKTISIEVQI